MAGITQTIPNYTGGISEQPDLLKNPGQVRSIQNGIPDVTYGLYKRPGSKRIGTTVIPNVQTGGSWFHYYRDETEGSYIGQVAADGRIRVWSCKDGTEKNVWYHTDNSVYNSLDSNHASISSYLSTTTPESIQALTINDTTFFSNRDKVVTTTGTTPTKPHTYSAYIELLRTENGRQYSLNISKSDAPINATISRATRVKIVNDTATTSQGTGHCPGIGTQVFSVTAASSYSTNVQTVPASKVGASVSNYITLDDPHGFKNEEEVVYSSPGTVITGLTSGTTYYVGRDYTVNQFSLSTTAPRALQSTLISLGTGTGDNSQTFTAKGDVISVKNSSGVTQTSGKENLIFRLTLLGQQGPMPGFDGNSDGDGADKYFCSYNKDVSLLHGGEGWALGDQVEVKMTTAEGKYRYFVEVAEIETTDVPNTTTSPTNYGGKIVRPTPTPFDADTAVTSDTVLGGIVSELSGVTIGGNALSSTIIGNGLYLSCDTPFDVEVLEPDLMRVMQSSVNDVTDLPNQCKHGYIVKIANARMSDEDDYYLTFEGENGTDGTGSWTECAKPGIVLGFNNTSMPHVLQRQADGDFLVKAFTYNDRLVGDDNTNPLPTFANGSSTINKVLFFRNRLAFLSGENVILCKPGTLASPDFFAETALTVSSVDPIDIACSSTYPSALFDGIELNIGLVLFSSNQQFLLASDDTVLNPDTAKLKSISSYNYNTVIPPITLGTTIGYIDNSGKYSRFNEMANTAREGEPIVTEVSKLVPSLLPKGLDLITNSRENQLILFGKTDTDIVYGLRYFRTGERQVQTAWFKWKLNNPLKYHFIIDDVYYYLDTDNFLQSINLIQSDDPSLVKDDNTFIVHMDNFISLSGGTYDVSTDLTTFTGVNWLTDVTTPNGALVVIDTNTDSVSVARYAEPTMTSTTSFTLTGDWSSASNIYIGYLYDYQVDFPRIYPTQIQGQVSRKDVNSSLIVHRSHINFGKIGTYQTTLTRVGKDDYTEIHESSISDEYKVSDIPYLVEETKTIPIYERNTNVDITLKSTHPSPCTLHSMSWEGDYSPKYYKRV